MITKEKIKKVKKSSDLEDYLETMMLMLSTELRGKYVREFEFHPKRKWRFDFAFLECKVAVEVDGYVLVRHYDYMHSREAKSSTCILV